MKKSHPYTRIGIVACGGKSTRMGFDKSLINYHGIEHAFYLYNMLSEVCRTVWLSCSAKQFETNFGDGYNRIADLPKYAQSGPMAALLSAFSSLKRVNILLVGCDYPLLSSKELSEFLTVVKKDQPAAFYHREKDLYEPLLAYYPGKSFTDLKQRFEKRQFSLHNYLIDNDAYKFIPKSDECLKSVDNPHELFAMKEKLKQVAAIADRG